MFYGFVELFLTTMNVCGTDEKHFSLVGSIVVTVVFFSTGFVLLQECGVGFSYAVRNFSEVFHHLIVPPSLCFFAAKFLELEKKCFYEKHFAF